jgi:glycosyltransferase involved in cell wall biosynthesis
MRGKVLYIGGFELPDKNAAAQRVVGISYSLIDLGYTVKLIGVSKGSNEGSSDKSYNGITYNQVPYPKGFFDWILYLFGLNNILTYIKNENPDKVILYNYPSIAMWRILRYCRRNNIKIYADITEWYEGEGNFFKVLIKNLDVKFRMNYLHFKFDGLIVISKFLNTYYSAKIKTAQVPPTFDIADSKFKDLSNIKSDRVDNKIKLVYSGSPGAGNKDRLDVIVNIVQKFKNIDFTIVGISYEQYVNLFGPVGDGKNIHFMGRLSHRKAIAIVKSSDFTIFYRGDTLTNRAGFPTKFAESISLGTPVITNSSSNVADYLNKYRIGFLIEGFNVDLFDSVLKKVSNMTLDEINDMKNNCLSFQPFDYKKYNEVVQIYLIHFLNLLGLIMMIEL